MLKKALLAGVLGVFLTTGAAFATQIYDRDHGGGCSQGVCDVSNPEKVELGLDFKIDVDACVDAGYTTDDHWTVSAVIYQDGAGNFGKITQNYANQHAGIVQDGNYNYAQTSQSDQNEYAFTYQDGCWNHAYITQTLQNAQAIITQLGNGNWAIINQQ